MHEEALGASGSHSTPPAVSSAALLLKGVAVALHEAQPTVPLLVPQTCMAAVYDGMGKHYVSHRDNVCSDDPAGRSSCHNEREFTAILYTNPAWDAARDGGCLRVFLGAALDDEEGGTAREVLDVEPRAGRLVIFRAAQLLHEVRPAFRERFALSLFIIRDAAAGGVPAAGVAVPRPVSGGAAAAVAAVEGAALTCAAALRALSLEAAIMTTAAANAANQRLVAAGGAR